MRVRRSGRVLSWSLAILYLATVPLYGILMWFSRTRLRPTYDALEDESGQDDEVARISDTHTSETLGVKEWDSQYPERCCSTHLLC